MSVVTLDYSPRSEFDAGRFVALYLQVLAWLSIGSMIIEPFVFDSLRVDLSPIFLFWAASGLKRHKRAARKWVLAIGYIMLGLILLSLPLAAVGVRFEIAIGFSKWPAAPLWLVALAVVAASTIVAVPLIVLRSERARRQFGVQYPH